MQSFKAQSIPRYPLQASQNLIQNNFGTYLPLALTKCLVKL